MSRLLSAARIVSSFLCFSVVAPPTPSSNSPAPSLIEVKGVRNSWDMEAKKSLFILSISLNLRHIRLNEAASSAISGGDERRRSASNRPLAISRVLFFRIEIGLVILRAMSSESIKIKRSEAIVIVKAASRARAPASANSLTLLYVPCCLSACSCSNSPRILSVIWFFSRLYHP